MKNIKELREICQPKKDVWPWRDKIVRGISIYITRLFLFTNISANGVTWIMLFVGIISAIFYTSGGYVYIIIGLILHHFYFILDAVDGEVARYRRTTSKKPISSDKGVYLDLMSHIIVHPLIVMGIAIGAYRNNPLSIPNELFLILGFIGAYSLMLTNFASVKKYELFVKKKAFDVIENLHKTLKGEDEKKVNWVKEEVWFLLSFEIFNLMFIFTILNSIWILVIIYSLIFSINAIKKTYLSYKYIEKVI